MAKLGFNAQDVRLMSHIEVNAWMESLLQSQGIKKQSAAGGAVHYNLMRRKKN